MLTMQQIPRAWERDDAALRVILAARSYVERAGTPSTPDDFMDHRIICGPSGAAGWTFERNGQVVTVDLQPHVTVNNNEGAVVAAIAGLG